MTDPSPAVRSPQERGGRMPRPVVESGRLVLAAGSRSTPWRDVYHYLLKASWPTVVGVMLVGYLLVTVLFAFLFLAGGDCIGAEDPQSFLLAFSFSVQTISTIGYGAMSPTTDYAHVLVATEVFVGLLGIGVATGIMFQKFARPTARVAFSEAAVVCPWNGVDTLMFRMVNERSGHIVDLRLNVTVLIDEVSSEGEFMRRFYPLPLERERSPVFAMSFTAMHRIDEASMLYGMSSEAFADRVVGFVITVMGIDDTIAQTVHSQYFYNADDVRFGHRFVDMIDQADGALRVRPEKLHLTEPVRTR